jgi:DNA-binding NarL/FixJ family response regulator
MTIKFLRKFLRSKISDPLTIFIVEDNSMYAKAMELFLKTGFSNIKEVKVFPVGETCLMELHKNPDLIIMDYFLNTKFPDAETGLEIIKQIRAIRPQQNIVVLSSQNDIAVVLEAVKKYKCDYIRKDKYAFGQLRGIVDAI